MKLYLALRFSLTVDAVKIVRLCNFSTGAKVLADGLVVKRLLQTEYFRLVVVEDAPTVEICGALKASTILCCKTCR